MKFRRKGVIALTAALCVALFASAAMAVNNETDLRNAVKNNGTVTLTGEIPLNDRALIIDGGVSVTLDLNGWKLSRTASDASSTYVIEVYDGATLTIEDSSANGGGTIESSNTSAGAAEDMCARGIKIGSATLNETGTGGHVIMNGGTIVADVASGEGQREYGGVGVALYANNTGGGDAVDVTFTMNGGTIQSGASGIVTFGNKAVATINDGLITGPGYAISGNGSSSGGVSLYGGTEININGGKLESTEEVVIYHTQDGVINITGGELVGADGIQMKSGEVNISGGTITANGEYKTDYGTAAKWTPTGAALSLLSQSAAGSGYVGKITANITGGTLTSENGNAIVEAVVNNAGDKFNALDIKGGTFIGNDTNGGAIVTTNAGALDTTITGGTFSSDLSNLKDAGVTVPEMTQDANGNYTAVTVPATDLSIDTSNLSEYIVGEELRLAVGQTLQLKVILTPATSNDVVVWTSSDESVATVSQSGLVRALKTGTVTITASITHPDAENEYMDEDLTITVVEAGSGGGGGCSAGFGALALLAAVPLLRMRKK